MARMSSLSLGTCGVLLLLLRGLLHTVQLGLGRALKEWGWPYFRLMAAACLISALTIAVGLVLTKSALPEPGQRKWVVLRGLFGAGGFVCSVLAAQVGAPLGDVESLRSVNMVAAAVLGWLFLGEPLDGSHLVALVCSAAGALLLCRPDGLAGGDGGAAAEGEAAAAVAGFAWLGYVLALASGVCQACVFVTSRKATSASPWVQALASHSMSSLAAGLLPLALSVEEEFDLSPMEAAPWRTVSWLVVLFAVTFVSTAILSIASQWCTAAESAIVSTSAGMAFGYAAQTVLFGLTPKPMALAGAALMLAGVAVTALGRTPAAGSAKAQPLVLKDGAAAARHISEDADLLPRLLSSSGCSRGGSSAPHLAGSKAAWDPFGTTSAIKAGAAAAAAGAAAVAHHKVAASDASTTDGGDIDEEEEAALFSEDSLP